MRPSALLPVYAEFPIRPVRGRGSWLIDEDGQEWLDAYGGHAVASTGHSHPDVVRAIAEQAGALLFYSTAVRHPLRIALAEVEGVNPRYPYKPPIPLTVIVNPVIEPLDDP